MNPRSNSISDARIGKKFTDREGCGYRQANRDIEGAGKAVKNGLNPLIALGSLFNLYLELWK
jgi:hypothetical protein